MRLSRLDLTRYGKFTDLSIDFGPAEAGRLDLHVIYGPNEAGKSTTFAAYLDLLFGIDQRTRYAFLHPYQSMRVGGLLELDGGARQLVRIKRPLNSLLDGNEQPVPEATVLGGLGGVDRESYRTMFSLDDHSLEAGGESILASKGDLGQLLFSASAGLAHLSQSLARIRAEADGFYRYRARSGELTELKTRLAALRQERETVDTLASEYGRLIEQRAAAEALYEASLRDRAAVQSRMDEVARHIRILPRLAEFRQRRGEIATLDGLPQPPRHWNADLPALQKAEIELGARGEAVSAEIEALSREIGAIVVDEAARTLTVRLEPLGDMRARYVTAEKDLPDRRLRLSELERRIAAIVRSLHKEGEPPASLVLDARALGTLRHLVERRSGIDAALAVARSEHARAEAAYAEAASRATDAGIDLDPGGGDGAPAAALAGALAAMRASDHPARRRLAERARATHADTLAERIAALGRWTGDLDTLMRMAVPRPSLIETWATRLDEAARDGATLDKEIQRLRSEERRLRVELDAAGRTSGVVTDQEAAVARAAREEAWAVHRGALDKATADAFEAALRQDDLVTNARLGRAGEVERLNQAARSLLLIEAALAEKLEAKAHAETELHAAREEMAAAMKEMSPGLPNDIGLQDLKDWLQRRAQVIEVARLSRQAERDVREAEEDGKALAGQLVFALALAGVRHAPDASIDMLMAAAQSALDGRAEHSAVAKRIVELKSDLDLRARALAEARAAEADWHADLAVACAGTWLAGAMPDVAGLREILERLGELEAILRDREGLADRIAKMEQDQTCFAGELRALAVRVGLKPDAAPIDLYRDLVSRVEQAKSDAELLADRRTRLDDAARRKAGIEAAATTNARLGGEMTALFGVETLGEVAEALAAVDRRAELRLQAERLEREVLEVTGAPSIEAAQALLQDADRSALEREFIELKARFDDLDQSSRELFIAYRKAAERVEMVGGDDAVARIEQQRRLVLLEIEEKARAYFRLRAGAAAAETALRTYRERHRSAMMARASAAFATISRGAYDGLATQPDRDSEILIAKAADGTSKVASDLSRGTRFQLYLALRVAGYLEYAASRRPVPFVADDIMETFDDFRAEEAFRLFGEMASVGQVIYLTHHQHLCAIAQRVCPGARIHELPASGR
ncbi:sugar translocase [Mesorhizobium sp. L-8-10]|uniref:YhaN family protein n=1 Tax=Mesorhizobium sp. L-8-10 TaxID=2744523 RepID=UPI0019267E57|nr:YhaN family protein [Mesorhizobium sp. L-8-10]BCH33876.1 sugar translocase [Mesorhizobium sp. L-8-10]